MSSRKSLSINVAIDSQISANASGGTETALLSLLLALGNSKLDNRFLILALKGYDNEITPYLSDDMDMLVWPVSYKWYDPSNKDGIGMSERWQRLSSLAGPLKFIVPILYRYYATDVSLSPKATRLRSKIGPLKFLFTPVYRFYRGIRDETTRPMVAARADKILKSKNVSVVHFPYPLHFETNLPFVYEPWGLPHHHQPECFRPGEAGWMDGLFGGGCRKAAMVVTATRWVKEDIIDKYNIDPAKIAVIPRLPRFDHAEHFMDKGEALKGLPVSFLLFPSATWVTKNHIRLIRAIGHLRDEHGVLLNLVCTGRTKTPDFEKIDFEIKQLGLEDQILFLGVVPVERLNTLYRSAKYLVHPSIFEGLGLPLLEAFHHELPVLASTAACIPEVVGDAALLFDPFDVDDIVRTLLEVERNPELLNGLRAKGKHRIDQDFPCPDDIAKMFDTIYLHAAKIPLNDEQKGLLSEMLN